ncbi:1-pyrroline-5-carboxylate dehydrogenase [Sesbania bispinosa]|nr:1-pyrroline-5-carboxylate dehydrogenase [Sesbania bispinosa]
MSHLQIETPLHCSSFSGPRLHQTTLCYFVSPFVSTPTICPHRTSINGAVKYPWSKSHHPLALEPSASLLAMVRFVLSFPSTCFMLHQRPWTSSSSPSRVTHFKKHYNPISRFLAR